MKKFVHSFLCLVLCLLFLFGCAPQEGKPSGSVGTTPSEASTPTDPSAPSGSIPAASVTFDLETAMRSSNGRLWETEAGFYYCTDVGLIYADKSDLSNWVIVCNKPDCEHDEDTCPAKVGGGFYLKDGRIYSLRCFIELTPDAKFSHAIYSIPADGSDDIRVEYPLDDLRANQAHSLEHFWRPDGFYLYYDTLLPSGEYDNVVMCVRADGKQVFHSWKTEDRQPAGCFLPVGRGTGDTVVYSPILAEQENGEGRVYRLTEDGYEEIPGFGQYDWIATLVLGDNLYNFVKDDGYYYRDLKTGRSEKWMDAQLKASDAFLFGTNCIVETSLPASYPPGAELPDWNWKQMRIYNGTEWKDVALPDDIWVEDSYCYGCLALTSTSFFFTICNRRSGESLYMVDLTQDELKAVRCAEIR